jgi:hypothetical protein
MLLTRIFAGVFCLVSQSSMAVQTATPISTAIPSIKIYQPHSPKHLCGLKNGGLYFSFFRSAIFSSSSPKKTMMPPNAARETAHISGSDEEEDAARKKLILTAVISMSALFASGIFCVVFYH